MEKKEGIFIIKTSHFLRSFKKLSYEIQDRTVIKIKLFQEFPDHVGLKVHKLNGTMQNLYAFWITHKIRIIFMRENEVVYFLNIGTHDDVYA